MKQILFALILLAAGGSALGQDQHFSQFFEAPLQRNPALAGIFTGDVRIQSIYRTQWTSVANAYKSGVLNAEYRLPIGRQDDYLTLGLQAGFDRAGDIGWSTNDLQPVVNYHKSLSAYSNTFLSVGFMGGIVNSQVDRSKFLTDDRYDHGTDGEPLTATQYHYLDGAAGICLSAQLNENPDNNFFIGVVLHHFNHPRYSFFRNKQELSKRWVASGGMRFATSETGYLTLQADYSMQGTQRELMGGALYALRLGEDPQHPAYIFEGGLFVRWQDAFVPVIKLDYRPFSVSLSYDVNLSPLKASSTGRGGFELGVTYVGMFEKDREDVRCPRF